LTRVAQWGPQLPHESVAVRDARISRGGTAWWPNDACSDTLARLLRGVAVPEEVISFLIGGPAQPVPNVQSGTYPALNEPPPIKGRQPTRQRILKSYASLQGVMQDIARWPLRASALPRLHAIASLMGTRYAPDVHLLEQTSDPMDYMFQLNDENVFDYNDLCPLQYCATLWLDAQWPTAVGCGATCVPFTPDDLPAWTGSLDVLTGEPGPVDPWTNVVREVLKRNVHTRVAAENIVRAAMANVECWDGLRACVAATILGTHRHAQNRLTDLGRRAVVYLFFFGPRRPKSRRGVPTWMTDNRLDFYDWTQLNIHSLIVLGIREYLLAKMALRPHERALLVQTTVWRGWEQLTVRCADDARRAIIDAEHPLVPNVTDLVKQVPGNLFVPRSRCTFWQDVVRVTENHLDTIENLNTDVVPVEWTLAVEHALRGYECRRGRVVMPTDALPPLTATRLEAVATFGRVNLVPMTDFGLTPETIDALVLARARYEWLGGSFDPTPLTLYQLQLVLHAARVFWQWETVYAVPLPAALGHDKAIARLEANPRHLVSYYCRVCNTFRGLVVEPTHPFSPAISSDVSSNVECVEWATCRQGHLMHAVRRVLPNDDLYRYWQTEALGETYTVDETEPDMDAPVPTFAIRPDLPDMIVCSNQEHKKLLTKVRNTRDANEAIANARKEDGRGAVVEQQHAMIRRNMRKLYEAKLCARRVTLRVAMPNVLFVCHRTVYVLCNHCLGLTTLETGEWSGARFLCARCIHNLERTGTVAGMDSPTCAVCSRHTVDLVHLVAWDKTRFVHRYVCGKDWIRVRNFLRMPTVPQVAALDEALASSISSTAKQNTTDDWAHINRFQQRPRGPRVDKRPTKRRQTRALL